MDRPLCLNELADLVGLAPSYLSRLFNQETGQSVSQYIMQLRVEKGRDLLIHTPMKVDEISNYIGFKQLKVTLQNVLKLSINCHR